MRVGRKLAFDKWVWMSAGVGGWCLYARRRWEVWVTLPSILWVHCIYSLHNLDLEWIQLIPQRIIIAWIVSALQGSPTMVAGCMVWFCGNTLLFGFCCLFPCLSACSKCSFSFDVSRSWWGVILHKETGKELQLPYLLFSLSAPWLSPLLYSWLQVFITFNSLPFCFSAVILHFQGERDCKLTAKLTSKESSFLFFSLMWCWVQGHF